MKVAALGTLLMSFGVSGNNAQMPLPLWKCEKGNVVIGPTELLCEGTNQKQPLGDKVFIEMANGNIIFKNTDKVKEL